MKVSRKTDRLRYFSRYNFLRRNKMRLYKRRPDQIAKAKIADKKRHDAQYWREYRKKNKARLNEYERWRWPKKTLVRAFWMEVTRATRRKKAREYYWKHHERIRALDNAYRRQRRLSII